MPVGKLARGSESEDGDCSLELGSPSSENGEYSLSGPSSEGVLDGAKAASLGLSSELGQSRTRAWRHLGVSRLRRISSI